MTSLVAPHDPSWRPTLSAERADTFGGQNNVKMIADIVEALTKCNDAKALLLYCIRLLYKLTERNIQVALPWCIYKVQSTGLWEVAHCRCLAVLRSVCLFLVLTALMRPRAH